MFKTKIIAFEGIDCSGKSTLIKHIERLFINKKVPYIKLREPGGSTNSEKIRKLLMDKKSNFNKKTDLLLYLASRSENIQKLLQKNTKKKIILLDRFIDSTIAYQHYAMGIDIRVIKYLNNFVIDKVKPDFTFLNIVNKKNLAERLKKRVKFNRYDMFNFKFYNKAQKGFLSLAKNKNKYMIINSNYDLNTNINQVKNKLVSLNLF